MTKNKKKDIEKKQKPKKDFVSTIKEKLPFHIEKNAEALDSKAQNEQAFEQLKEGATVGKNVKGTKKKLFTFTVGSGKDAKAKRELKQSEKGIILIVAGLMVAFVIFNFFYKPLELKRRGVVSLATESAKKRNEVETQLAQKEKTEAKAKELDKQLTTYKTMYPNYRTQNEILLLLNTVLGGYVTNLSSITVDIPSPVQKATVYEDITNKNIAGLLKNSAYFAPSTTEGENTGSTTTTGGTTAKTKDTTTQEGGEAAPDTKFEYTEATFSVTSLSSLTQALEVVRSLHESNRVIIPSRIKIVSGDSKFSVEGTLYFYAYRNTKDAENLF